MRYLKPHDSVQNICIDTNTLYYITTRGGGPLLKINEHNSQTSMYKIKLNAHSIWFLTTRHKTTVRIDESNDLKYIIKKSTASKIIQKIFIIEKTVKEKKKGDHFYNQEEAFYVLI